MAHNQGLELVERDADGVDTAFRADVLEGLSQDQKAIPARWLYDDAGSQLFEDITQLPEYYPTRAETEILTEQAASF
ncbi:MAG: L-histidine N(alpha)-methyltransferase, partial [Pseudomonadota bacterium]